MRRSLIFFFLRKFHTKIKNVNTQQENEHFAIFINVFVDEKNFPFQTARTYTRRTTEKNSYSTLAPECQYFAPAWDTFLLFTDFRSTVLLIFLMSTLCTIQHFSRFRSIVIAIFTPHSDSSLHTSLVHRLRINKSSSSASS